LAQTKLSTVEFLTQLCNNLDHSATAYKDYLAAGKTFRYAKELKKYNGAIVALINTNKELLTGELVADADSLLHHYAVWTVKWEHLAATNPQPDDEFVFANEVTFPREAAKRLEAAYHHLAGH
jgi:hypothetical protein